eukprot:scpid37009/ scgid8313/ 
MLPANRDFLCNSLLRVLWPLMMIVFRPASCTDLFVGVLEPAGSSSPIPVQTLREPANPITIAVEGHFVGRILAATTALPTVSPWISCPFYDVGRGKHSVFAPGEEVCFQLSPHLPRQRATCKTQEDLDGISPKRWRCSDGSKACWMMCMVENFNADDWKVPNRSCSCDPRSSLTPSKVEIGPSPSSSAVAPDRLSAETCDVPNGRCNIYGRCVQDLRHMCGLPWLFNDVPCNSTHTELSYTRSPKNHRAIHDLNNATMRTHALGWKMKAARTWADTVNKCIQTEMLAIAMMHQRSLATSIQGGQLAPHHWITCSRVSQGVSVATRQCHHRNQLPAPICTIEQTDRELILWTRASALAHTDCETIKADADRLRCGRSDNDRSVWSTSIMVVVNIESHWRMGSSHSAPRRSPQCVTFWWKCLSPCRKWKKIVSIVRRRVERIHVSLPLPNRGAEGPGPGVNTFLVADINEEVTDINNRSSNNTKAGKEVKLRSSLLLELVVSPVLARNTNYNTASFNWTGHLEEIVSILNGAEHLVDRNVSHRVRDDSGAVIRSKIRITAAVPGSVYAMSESRTPSEFDAYLRRHRHFSSSGYGIHCMHHQHTLKNLLTVFLAAAAILITMNKY